MPASFTSVLLHPRHLHSPLFAHKSIPRFKQIYYSYHPILSTMLLRFLISATRHDLFHTTRHNIDEHLRSIFITNSLFNIALSSGANTIPVKGKRRPLCFPFIS